MTSSPNAPNRVLDSEQNVTLRQTWRDLLLIFAVSLPLFFWQLGGWALFDPDEGRYAEIPREMMVRGDWITPTLNYAKYFEKPPLFYWLVALSFKIFGPSEWSARLVSALCALLGLVLVYVLARRMFGRRVGLLSAGVLATNLFWPIMARFVIIDTTLSVAIFAAIVFWWLGHTEETRRKNAYFAAFWVSLSLAFLSKGPVAVLLTGASIFLYCALCRQWKSWRECGWIWGIPLMTLLVAPWFVAVALQNPEFNRYFWWGQNVARFLGIGKNREHVQSPFYYLFLLPLILFPWSFLMPAALMAGRKRLWPKRGQTHSPRQRALIYLACNAGFITLFFSASTGKLITYVLPAVPPLAILIALYLERTWRFAKTRTENRAKNRDEMTRVSLRLGVVSLSLMLLALGIAAWLLTSSTRLPRALEKLHTQVENVELSPHLLQLLASVAVLWALAQLIALAKRRARALFAIMGSGFAAFFLCFLMILIAIAPGMTMKTIVEFARPGLNRGAQMVMYQSYTQSIGFYQPRRLVSIDREGELWFGVSRLSPIERATWFPKGFDTLEKLIDSPLPVYVLVDDHKTAQNEILPRLNGKAVELFYNRKHSLIGNRAAAAITPPRL